MKILYFLIITIMVFSGIGLVFAQVTTYPPYENYGGYSDICTNADIVDDFTSDITPNYIRNTMVSYGGTNLITTIVPGKIIPSQTISLVNYGYFGQYALSNSTLLSVDSLKKISTDGIHGVRNVTLGLTNIGNKTVTVVVPGYTPTSLVVVNSKSGATVNGVDDYDFATYKTARSLDNMIPIKLEPGESIMRQTWNLETIYDFDKTQHDPMGSIIPTHQANIGSGNYTMTAVSRFLAATDKGCTMMYLWSHPVDLTVLQQSNGNNSILDIVSGPNIHFSWVPPLSDGGSAITHYKVERSTDEKNWTTILLSPSQLYYNDHGVEPGTTYYYRMSAINAIGTSLQSEIMSQTIPQSKGGGNSTLSAISDTNFHLSWTAPLYTSGSAITHYNIERSTDEKNWTAVSLPPSQLYYDDHGLDPGTTYHYRISAINATNGIVYTSEVISKTALWSKPIQTNVANETIPEFPFAISILLIGFASVIVFYRLKFVK